MDFPDDLKYSRSHEWVRVEEDGALVGISAYAAEELGDIVYVELPEEDTEVDKDVEFGVIESVKATADLYAPVSGKVIETNTPLEDTPEVLNEDPYGDGWLVRIALRDPSDMDDLMDAEEYQNFVKEESES